MSNETLIYMIKNLAARNSVVASADVRVLIAALEEKDQRIAELEQKAHELKSERDTFSKSEWKMAGELTELQISHHALEQRLQQPGQGEVLVTVSGFTGCGKSAVAGEIEIALRAIGLPVVWTNGDAEKRMTGADWLTALEMYKPRVRIVEQNVVGDKRYV
nr:MULTISPECIES: ead/Ea22-like family protein [unclassified Serratia (in: enterobacteria)]